MRNGHKRVLAGTTLAGLAVSAGFLTTSAQAQPDVKTVQAEITGLYHQAETITQRYNAASEELDALNAALKNVQADQATQTGQLNAVRLQLRDAVLNQYEGSGAATVGSVVTSSDPSGFLSRLSTMSAYQTLQSNMVQNYSTQVTGLAMRSAATKAQVAKVEKTKQQMLDLGNQIRTKLDRAKTLLATLSPSEQTFLTDGTSTALPANLPPASGRAAVAVQFALAQLGKPYVWGAAGLGAYDCSGLTMRAWAQAGVGMSHYVPTQVGAFPRVPIGALQPGDLISYNGGSHVGMYIGGGRMVNAENPRVGVVTEPIQTPWFRIDFAVRPG